jgi:MYND finger
MSAQGLEVSQSLDKCLSMLPAYSKALFEVAQNGYDHRGRGSLVTMFPNIEAMEREKMNVWHYLPREVLAEMDYSQVLHFVDMYDPKTQFVALATVNIKKPRAGKDNAIMLCKMISRDTELVIQPNYGVDGRVLPCQTLAGEDLTDAVQRGNVLNCAASHCNATENLRVCGGCRDARYCSKECQLSHRPLHRNDCKALKAAKDQAEAFLRSQQQS